jgi:hypothetical protein
MMEQLWAVYVELWAAGHHVAPEFEPRKLILTTTTQTLPAETGGTDITRFNALRHGVLSRYTVPPWENADEYRAVVEALVAEHGPQGPTEEPFRARRGRPVRRGKR